MVTRWWAWLSETRCYTPGCCRDFSVSHLAHPDCRASATISQIRRSLTKEKSSLTTCFLLSSERTPWRGETKTKMKRPRTTSGSRIRCRNGCNPQRFMNSNLRQYSAIHSQEYFILYQIHSFVSVFSESIFNSLARVFVYPFSSNL